MGSIRRPLHFPIFIDKIQLYPSQACIILSVDMVNTKTQQHKNYKQTHIPIQINLYTDYKKWSLFATPVPTNFSNFLVPINLPSPNLALAQRMSMS